MTDKEKPAPPTIEELEARNEAPWKTALDVEPYADEVSLFENVKQFLKHYLCFTRDFLFDVLTAWILATYHMEKWRALGPLVIVGPTGSGKTTVLECLEELVWRGIRGGSMSNSTMFRLSDKYGPTLLVDESQVYNRDEWAETQAFLNERYKRGGKIWRMVGEGAAMIPCAFKAYGATALAQSDQPWEAMASRAIRVKMEKGRPKEETLTEPFYQEAGKLRGQLKQYRTRREKLPHQETDLDREIEKRLAEAKTSEEKIRIVTNPFPDPASSLDEIKEPRVREIGYALVCCAPDTGPRASVVAYLKRLEQAHQADEDTSYSADIFRAFDCAQAENGRVRVSDVRAQLMIIWDIEKSTDKRMPHPKTVMNALKTMGFDPTRTPHENKAAVVYDPALVERLRLRYGVTPPPVTSTSSTSSTLSMNSGGASGAGGANPGGAKGERERVLDAVKRLTTTGGYQFVTAPTVSYDTRLDVTTVETTFRALASEGHLVQDRQHIGHFRPSKVANASLEGS